VFAACSPLVFSASFKKAQLYRIKRLISGLIRSGIFATANDFRKLNPVLHCMACHVK
jgi:hypothetical protein